MNIQACLKSSKVQNYVLTKNLNDETYLKMSKHQ